MSPLFLIWSCLRLHGTAAVDLTEQCFMIFPWSDQIIFNIGGPLGLPRFLKACSERVCIIKDTPLLCCSHTWKFDDFFSTPRFGVLAGLLDIYRALQYQCKHVFAVCLHLPSLDAFSVLCAVLEKNLSWAEIVTRFGQMLQVFFSPRKLGIKTCRVH